MKIVNLKLSELKPYKNNPRKNDEAVKYIKESIKEFGFKVPIIISKNNEIIAGHTRLKAAKELELEEVPCIIASDLSEEQAKAFRLIDNKVAEKAGWDFELLESELAEIIDIDMEEFGFEDFDDVPNELDIERTTDDGEKVFLNYLKYSDKEIPITEEEIEKLNKKYKQYTDEYTNSYGFVNFLIGE